MSPITDEEIARSKARSKPLRTLITATWLLELFIAASARAASPHLADAVDTRRGSNSDREYSHGNTFPAVALPFGFNLWTPITEGNSDRWLYRYSATSVQGFGVSHEPSPWIGEHGSFQIMPMVKSLRVSPEERAAAFTHGNEIAKPYYYQVKLDDSGVVTEMTPTARASVFRFTFPEASPAYVLFDLIDTVNGSMSVDTAKRTVQGFVDQNGPRLYFFGRIDTSIAKSGANQGKGANAWVQLDVRPNQSVSLSLATSFISPKQAAENLAVEVGNRTFDQVRDSAQAVWDAWLGKIEISGASVDDRAIFYSNLYRTLLYPNAAFERVGQTDKYFSPYSNALRNGRIYVNNGFWDTYRAVWPLFSLLSPKQAGDMLQGFVTTFEDGGWVPRWSGPGYVDCMVGTNSDIVFADSYLRDVKGFDIRAAYRSMLKNALVASSDGAVGRKGNERSIFLGYVPTDVAREAASWTLEDAIDDFGIAEISKALGEATNAEYFYNRAKRYSLLYSAQAGFFRGKQTNGGWRTPNSGFFADEWGNEFAEGNAWHYAVSPSTDFQGLANLLGGRSHLARRIDALLRAPRAYRVGSYGQVIHEMREAFDANMGQYAHANEPVHSTLYAYDYTGEPYKTQAAVREVVTRLYDTGAGSGNGYIGDEDNGQMSAWYVFSALGIYPASPGHPEYAIGSPLFAKATIHLENGKTLEIVANNVSEKNKYIHAARIDGSPYTKPYVLHAALLKGGTLEFDMGDKPSNWGTNAGDLPHSMTPATNDRVPAFRMDRATGGTVSTSSESVTPDVNGSKAFDDDSRTAWRSPEPKSAIQYRFANGRRYPVTLYTITSASDAPDRDPKDWSLQGSLDCVNWVALDHRTDESFAWRQYTRAFSVKNGTPFACYRLSITANHGAPLTQIAELELIGSSPIASARARPSPSCGAETSALKASDGSLATKWCSHAPNATLVIDLSKPWAVTQVMVHHAQAGEEASRLNTQDFTIEVSSDDKHWTKIATIQGNRDAVTQSTIAPTPASAVRIVVSKPNHGVDNETRIYEVEVYGTPLADRGNLLP